MDETTRKRLLASLPEKVNCPACAGQLVRPALVCAGKERRCERLLGQCSEVLPYIPAGLLGPEDEASEETPDRGASGLTMAQRLCRATAEAMAEVKANPAASNRAPLTLTPDEEALLHPPIVRGPGYPTPEASAEAARMNGPINRARREGRKAAAVGDREGLDGALGILTVLLETRAELRHPEPAEEASTEQPEDAAEPEASANSMPAPEPARPGLLLELHDTNQGHRIADHLEAFARSLRSDLGQFEASVSIRRLARNGAGNGRGAG